MTSETRAPLAPEQLCRRCDPSSLGFETTERAAPLAEPLGQERAVEALTLGVTMRHPGYHVFAMGPSAMGKRTLVERVLRGLDDARPTPSDWVYLHDFAAPHNPKAVELPAGVPFRGALPWSSVACSVPIGPLTAPTSVVVSRNTWSTTMGSLTACPNCGRTAKKALTSNFFPVSMCLKCKTKYCKECGGNRCPNCGDSARTETDKVYA